MTPQCTCPETDPLERAGRYTVAHLGQVEPHSVACPRWGTPTAGRRDRYAQCDDTCTVDCGACKGGAR